MRRSYSEPHSRFPAGTRKLDVLAAWATTRPTAKAGGHSTGARLRQDAAAAQTRLAPPPVDQQIQDARDYRDTVVGKHQFPAHPPAHRGDIYAARSYFRDM